MSQNDKRPHKQAPSAQPIQPKLSPAELRAKYLEDNPPSVLTDADRDEAQSYTRAHALPAKLLPIKRTRFVNRQGTRYPAVNPNHHLIGNKGGIGKQPYSVPIDAILAMAELPKGMQALPQILLKLWDYQNSLRTFNRHARHPQHKRLSTTYEPEETSATTERILRYSKPQLEPAIQGFTAVWYALFTCNLQALAPYKLTDEQLTGLFRLFFPEERFPATYCARASNYRTFFKHMPKQSQSYAAALTPLTSPKTYTRYIRLQRYLIPTNPAKRPKNPLGKRGLLPYPATPQAVTYLATSAGRLVQQLWPLPASALVLLPRVNNGYLGYYTELLGNNR